VKTLYIFTVRSNLYSNLISPMAKCFTLLFPLMFWGFLVSGQTAAPKKQAPQPVKANPAKALPPRQAVVAPRLDSADAPGSNVLVLLMRGDETAQELLALDKGLLALIQDLKSIPGENESYRYLIFPNAVSARMFQLGNPDLILLSSRQLRAITGLLNCPSDRLSPDVLVKLSGK
jgi:hypothetical protein